MNLPQSKFQEPTTSKSLKGFKLWRTSNLTFSKTSLKLHTKKQWLGLSLRIIEYPTNEYKPFSYTFRIDQIPFTYGERKKERLNFPRICSQNLLISAAFTTILKMKPTQCNAIRGDWMRQIWKNVLKSHFFPLASSWNKTSKILAITFIS